MYTRETIRMLVVTASTFATAAAFTYTPTPFGEVLSHCVHEVPNGALTSVQADGRTFVTAADGKTSNVIPACDTAQGAWPIWRRRDGRLSSSRPLPPDYDGWLQYTALNTSALGLEGGFDAFTSTMSVPDVPKRMAQQLFFFPGLQNRDWIPKVDPAPTRDAPFDIVQPVLQYPGGLFNRKEWALKSWYVTVNAGALYSKAITGIKPGDAILCNMTRTGPQSWRIAGALKSDPSKVTIQEATAARLALQPWAYSAVAECYGCNGCDTYPVNPIKFTDNRLYQGSAEVRIPTGSWRLNPKPAVKLMCNESTTVDDNGDATIAFR